MGGVGIGVPEIFGVRGVCDRIPLKGDGVRVMGSASMAVSTFLNVQGMLVKVHDIYALGYITVQILLARYSKGKSDPSFR